MDGELTWLWMIGTAILWLAALGAIVYAIVGLLRKARQDRARYDDRQT